MTVLQEEVISLGSGGLTGGLVDPELGRGLWGRRGVTSDAAKSSEAFGRSRSSRGHMSTCDWLDTEIFVNLKSM
jgi:hypothetical protein